MPANKYRFVEHWIIPNHSPQEVWDVIADAELLPAWWKGVYLEAKALEKYEKPIVGAKARVKARGFLPYKLNFILEAIELEPGKVIATKAHGDFEGVWRGVLSPENGGTRVDITWEVTVQKPLIRIFSPLLKPLFAWNHNWTTPRGEAGLRAYLAEHHKQTADS